MIVGLIIGIEREISNHPAGMRTHALVCIGTTLTSLMACEMCSTVSLFTKSDIDISRIAAGVVTGIGFIGAGAIIKARHSSNIYGLTTAATIWVTGCLGLTIGMGYYIMSLVSLLAIFIVTVTLKVIERKLIYSRSIVDIKLSFVDQNDIVSFIEKYCERRHIQIIGIKYFGDRNMTNENGERIYNCHYSLKLPRNFKLKTIITDFSLQENIIDVFSETKEHED